MTEGAKRPWWWSSLRGQSAEMLPSQPEPVITSTRLGDIAAVHELPPSRFVIELDEDGSNSGPVCLLENEEPVFEGSARDAVGEMYRRGLKRGDRYLVRSAQKEIELRAISRADRAAGEKAVVARRDLSNEVS